MPTEVTTDKVVTVIPTPGSPVAEELAKKATEAKQARIKELRSELDKLDPPDVSMDKYGRTAFERTVELEVDDAERVDHEVTAGEHKTFSDGLHYIVERGVAEIKRQRDSLKALKEQRNDARTMAALRTAVANNPELMTNPTKLADVMKSLGIKLTK